MRTWAEEIQESNLLAEDTLVLFFSPLTPILVAYYCTICELPTVLIQFPFGIKNVCLSIPVYDCLTQHPKHVSDLLSYCFTDDANCILHTALPQTLKVGHQSIFLLLS